MDNRNIRKFGINGHDDLFDEIISLKNLFTSWDIFKKGKECKLDIQDFALSQENNIFQLHAKLKNGHYRHANYISFFITDPKLRAINKAQVRDRVLHHAIVRAIEPLFERNFIYDSYSSRKEKGSHKAIKRLYQFAWKLSRNDTKIVWVLKCDIRKFFDSVDHEILLNLLKREISDQRVIKLLSEIIDSYDSALENQRAKGIPLGNLTSQLFSNVYLNPLDQFVKRNLKAKYYVRYADDFVILSCDKESLEKNVSKLKKFLREYLRLELHPSKLTLRKFSQGIDFLGYVVFPHHTILRTKTKKRMIRKISKKQRELANNPESEKSFEQTIQSYLGVLSHCRGEEIRKKIEDIIHS